MNNNKEGTMYFDGESWCYVIKEVDKKTFQINIIEKNGFLSPLLAAQAMEKDIEQFQKDMTYVKKATGMEYTFGEYLEYWYKNILQSYAAGNYQQICGWVIFKVIIPSIEKDVLIHMVTTSYINELLKRIAPMSKTAAPQARKLIKLALKDALLNGYIQTDLMAGVDEYHDKVPKVVVFSKEQIRILLKEAYDYHSIYLEILMGMFCGLRPGEILGLKFSDFNFEEKTVSIQRQITRDYVIDVNSGNGYKILGNTRTVKPPKSYSSYRIIRVPDFVLNEVEIRMEENKKVFQKHKLNAKTLGDYICISQKGELKSDGTVLAGLDRICKRQSLPHISCHDLRHLCASILIEQNVPLERISKMLGHKSVNTTLDVYIGIIQAKEQIRDYVDENLDPINVFKKEG